MDALIPKSTKMLPMKFSQLYLWGTFLIFLSSNFIDQIDNLFLLTVFVLSAYSLFYFGYLFGVNAKGRSLYYSRGSIPGRLRMVNVIVMTGSVYFIVWGVNQINDFGGGSISDVLMNVLSPGASYKAKFDVYEYRLSTGAVNGVTRVLILLSFIYAIFIPVLVFYWRVIGFRLRIFAVISIFIYLVSFLYIGTQKGIGDVLLFLVTGIAILVGSGSEYISRAAKKKMLLIFMSCAGLALFYMAVNQSSRGIEFGISESKMFGDISKTWLAHAVGEQMAYGIYTIISYPSHGYAGLSYNLNQEFVFSYGAGFSQAFESYRLQYLGGNENFYLTYPARTEDATGWPWGMYWATVFPWFASDLTFFGAAILMFFIGYLFARVWLSCISKKDLLSFAALGQLIIFVLFIPANNQVLMGRQGLWVVISIICIWLFRGLNRGKA